MRMRGRTDSQTIGIVYLTREHTAGKKKKEDNPLVARDIPQIVQAVVDLLQHSPSHSSDNEDNGITQPDESWTSSGAPAIDS